MAGKLRPSRFGLVALLVLAALAGCGRYYFAEREPWRKEAEVACLKSGSVKEGRTLVRIEPINGPGMCGADFPLKVAAFGEEPLIGYSDDIRPPGAIPSGAQQPRWPIAEPRYNPPGEPRYSNPYGTQRPSPPTYDPLAVEPSRNAVQSAPLGAPMQISPPGLAPSAMRDDSPYMRAVPSSPTATGTRRPSVYDAPRGSAADDDEDADDMPARARPAPPRMQNERLQNERLQNERKPLDRPATVPLGRNNPVTGAIGPVEVKPTATLACPIVSALDQWIAAAVQPSAKRWFGQPVAEIKQISAYSCRGMNGQAGARISEHAFGNALDIAAFILADGRKVTVKDGWRGTPEEQGFLRDIQGAACEQFTTVLAPGSNRFHYDHIHVDLMRRPSGRVICNPDAISGEVVAARAAKERGMYARRGDPSITGSIATRKEEKKPAKNILKKFQVPEEDDEDDWIEDDGPRPSVN